MAADGNEPTQIAQAVTEISEKASLLIREEIELAKAEITEKATKLAKGAGIGAAAGIFVLGARHADPARHRLAALVRDLPGATSSSGASSWRPGILILLAALAGFIASRLLKSGAPPTPDLAIEEAQRIRTTVTSKHPETTV